MKIVIEERIIIDESERGLLNEVYTIITEIRTATHNATIKQITSDLLDGLSDLDEYTKIYIES